MESLIPLYICAVIALYAAVRLILEPDIMQKLPFLNVFSFAIAGTVVLLSPEPLTLIVAVVFFVGSTLESNAIASSYAGGKKEND